ncbi:MAG: hypothetical protein JWO25_3811 [Alphaproteobacteria bacterium]|nr:hypothetical protein [Alphaproteobacteria bacterium]MDB5720968.1 hypothetical protein [Alphaproteobacteria bacterium]
MSEVRPTGETDGAARLAAAARDRLAVGLADLRLPDAWRLTEWQRSTVSALLDRLVRAIESELRGALASSFAEEEALHASLGSAHVEIAMLILGAAPPWEPALVGALLRRAEEHRLHRGSGDHALLIELAGDDDSAIAAEAMSLLIAQSGRFDSFQEPVISRTELPAELEHGLVWTVAAALRRYIVGTHNIGTADADKAIAAAAGALLGGYDEGEAIAARSLRLMRRLATADRLDDEAVVRSLIEGGLPLFLAAVAIRSGIDPDSAWELLSDPDARGGALLLRGAALGKEAAGTILFRLNADTENVAGELDRFEALTPGAALSLLGLWQADPAYRAAVARMAS